MSGAQDRGALAIVLHTHMPYVEGFGTWPFGEEWLWEAIASCYLPVLELLDGGAPLTLSVTPVLLDQLEAPHIQERFAAFVTEVRRTTHQLDAKGLRDTGMAQLASEVERCWSEDYAGAPARLAAIPGGLAAGLARHASWTSSATHAILPLLATDASLRLQVQSGIDSHRRRTGGEWRGGFWLPECAYAPWLLRALEDAGVAAVCVELTGELGLCSPDHLQPLLSDAGVVLVPLDRATIDLVWGARGYPAAGAYRDYHHLTVHHHNPWNNAGDPYDRQAALVLAREHAQDFVARTIARLAQARAARGDAPLAGGGLVVCAIDTELLGHWWYEGTAWLAAVVQECARQGLELLELDDALARHMPVPGAPGQTPCSWGQDGDLSTWSGPPVAEMAFATRAAELEVIRAGSAAGACAVRELLALQSSDWAFMLSRGIASPYARERFDGHRAGLSRALAGGTGAGEALRNLAVDADPAILLAP